MSSSSSRGGWSFAVHSGSTSTAGAAGTGPAAFGDDRKAVVADDLHHPPAFDGFKPMLEPILIHKNNTHSLAPDPVQATPSFFCRLVDEVVYWKVTLASGLA